MQVVDVVYKSYYYLNFVYNFTTLIGVYFWYSVMYLAWDCLLLLCCFTCSFRGNRLAYLFRFWFGLTVVLIILDFLVQLILVVDLFIFLFVMFYCTLTRFVVICFVWLFYVTSFVMLCVLWVGIAKVYCIILLIVISRFGICWLDMVGHIVSVILLHKFNLVCWGWVLIGLTRCNFILLPIMWMLHCNRDRFGCKFILI